MAHTLLLFVVIVLLLLLLLWLWFFYIILNEWYVWYVCMYVCVCVYTQLPLETLALQSDRIILVDHHTHVFVWSGEDVTDKRFDLFRQACVQRVRASSKWRIPTPKILVFEVYYT